MSQSLERMIRQKYPGQSAIRTASLFREAGVNCDEEAECWLLFECIHQTLGTNKKLPQHISITLFATILNLFFANL